MKFSHEPVLYLSALIIALQIVVGALNHKVDDSLIPALVTAAGALVIRQKVYSPATVKKELLHDISGPVQEEELLDNRADLILDEGDETV